MERLWNRNYCKVMAANFSLFFAFYVLTPLLPLYLSEHFGATKDMIGLVLSGYSLCHLLCGLSGSFHLIIIYDRTNLAWWTFWYAYHCQRHGGY